MSETPANTNVDGEELAAADRAGEDTAARPATAEAESPHTPEITDVWSWTARKYRIRATVLLCVNVVLFCGLCVFTHWLHVGHPFDFGLDSYLQPLRFWGDNTQNLYDFILFPISVDQTPLHGVVIGLLIASIVAVPVCVSILYRFKASLPFTAAVLVFAHMPWMAITLLGSCILASVRPFRMKFRYGSALVAMLPVLLYLLLATRGADDPLSGSISPERRLLLAAPWVLAILAACTMMAVIIFLARTANYRPGAVAPVMAVMFATPAVLFHSHVGVDELNYRVLEAEYGPRSTRFEPVQDATDMIRAMLHTWTHPGRDIESLRAALLPIWSADPQEQARLKNRVSRRLLLELLYDRRAAHEACREFIADHPSSRYVPNVLFIQARALDTRLDERALGTAAQRELYTDFPHVQSEAVWTNLLTQYPHSPLAVAAQLRVAQLRVRQGDAVGALRVLSIPLGPAGWTETQPATERPLLRSAPPEQSLDFEPDDYVFEARRLRELIINNLERELNAETNETGYGAEPLQALASLDLHRAGYRNQLQLLARQYKDSLLYDNIAVRWADAQADRVERAARLRACIANLRTIADKKHRQYDALPEAMYQLADLEAQTFGAEDETARAAGLARFRAIIEEFSGTCWAQLAEERLRMIQPPATQTTE